MTRVHSSILLSAIDRYGNLLLFLFSTAILSRLLDPTEFGIYAVINAVTTVLMASFQEFGGANYLIQKKSLSVLNIRTAFTITFGISVLIGLLLFACRDILGWFFSQDGIDEGIAAAAINFVSTPFAVVTTALFRRELQFGKLAICSLASSIVTALLSIFLALHQFSFMAPVWGAVVGNVVGAFLLIALSADRSIFRPSLSGYQDVMKFGLYSAGVSLINVFYNLAPQVFLARILDFAAVGLYSRAVGVTQVFDKLVGQVLAPVIMPAILIETKAGGNLKQIYLNAISLLTGIHWPFLAFMSIMAHPIILLWLGPTWLEVVPLVRILCVAYLSLFAACLTYPVLVAVGSVRDALISSLISLPPSLVAILIASFLGVQAVAAVAMLTLPFQAAVAIYFVSRHLSIRPMEIGRATFKSGIVGLSTSASALVFAVMIDQSVLSPLIGLSLACVSAMVCWLVSMIVTEHILLPRLLSAARDLLYAPMIRAVGLARRHPAP